MKIILVLLIGTLMFGQVKKDYEREVAADMLALTELSAVFMDTESLQDVVNSNKILLIRMVETKNIYVMDTYVLIYLDYKKNIMKQLAKAVEDNQLKQMEGNL